MEAFCGALGGGGLGLLVVVGLRVVVLLGGLVVLGGLLVVVGLLGALVAGGLLPAVPSGGLLMAVKIEISSSDKSPKSGMSLDPILLSCTLGFSGN